MMKDYGYLIFVLVAAYLVGNNWSAFNAVITTASETAHNYTQVLQGRTSQNVVRTL